MKIERCVWTAVVVALVAACVAGCGDKQPPPPKDAAGARLEKVTLGLNWFPEAEHGGFYAAQVHGYFAEEGLEVEIVKGGTESPILQQVAVGQRDFGVTNADNILFGRAQEAPVVAVMAPLQTSPRCLIVHAESGIRRFEDLKDMTIAMSVSSAFTHYLRTKVPLTGVTIVPYSGNVARFLTDKTFAQQGYVLSEPFVARQLGADPHVLMVSDLGFNPYTSLLFTREETVSQRPDLLRKMVAASVRGWRKYLESPAETNRLIARLNPDMAPDALAYGAETIAPLVLDEVTRKSGIGHMTVDRWRTLEKQLVECEQLKKGQVDPTKAFTTEFLPAPKAESAGAP